MDELEEFEFRRRFEMENQAKPEATLRQKIQASAPMRIVQGIRDPIDAAAQLLPRGLEFVSSAGGLAPNAVSEFFGSEAQRVDAGINQNDRKYSQARAATGQEGMDLARFGGNIVSPANLAIASKLPAAVGFGGRIAQGAAAGAVGGALQPVNTEESRDFVGTKLGQVALGAAVGGGTTPVLGSIGDFMVKKLSQMKGPSVTSLNVSAQEYAKEIGMDWGKMGNQQKQELIQQARDAAKAYAGTDPKAALRIKDFKELEMPYTLGQVTREPLQFATEKNLTQMAGVGDPLRERFMQQGSLMQREMGNFAANADETQRAGAAIVEALRKYDEKLSSNVSSAYKKARESAGKDADVPLQGLSQDFAEVMNTFGNSVPDAVRSNFAKFGIGADDLAMNQRKVFTVDEAEKLLKIINANQSNNPATNAALGALRGAVKKSITQDAGVEDVFAPARKLAAERFKLQEAVPALEASATGAVNPDTFVQNFILGKGAQTKQVQQLANILRDEENPEMFNQAKAQIGAYLQRKAFGENVTGDKPFSPERFQTALREIGSDKLGAFFSPAELKRLQQIGRVGSYIESVPNAAKPNTSGNWGAITNLPLISGAVSNTAALANALRSGMSNQLNVSKALAAKPAQLSTDEIRMMSKLLSGAGVASGAYQGAQLNQQ